MSWSAWVDFDTREGLLYAIDGAKVEATQLQPPEERERLDEDCIATLRFLEESEILDPESREWVINGLMLLHGEDISPDEVRWMSLIVLWSRGQIEHYTFLEEFLLNETTLH